MTVLDLNVFHENDKEDKPEIKCVKCKMQKIYS